MAGGTLVLGGIVAAPALAITGLHLAGKGEKALTQARDAKLIPNPTIKVAPKHEQLTTEFFVAV